MVNAKGRFRLGLRHWVAVSWAKRFALKRSAEKWMVEKCWVVNCLPYFYLNEGAPATSGLPLELNRQKW